MDLDRPLNSDNGFITYHTLMDYIDMFIMNYMTRKHSGHYPSLRATLDMLITVIGDLKDIEIDEKDLESADPVGALIDKLHALRKEKQEVFDSRKIGLLIDEFSMEQVEEINPILTDDDINFLCSMKIKVK